MPVDTTSPFASSNETKFAYSGPLSILAGFGVSFEWIVGFTLNALVILALLKDAKLRKEYLTPAIISLALTDLIYSMYTCPVLSFHFFMKYVSIYCRKCRK